MIRAKINRLELIISAFLRVCRSYAAAYSFITIFQAGIRLLVFVLAAKLLGPEEYAQWPLIQAIMSYSMFIGFGIMPALGMELPILKGGGKAHRYKLFLVASLRFLRWFWVAILLFAGLLIAISPVSRFFAYGALLSVLQSMIHFFVHIRRSELNFKRLFFAILLSVVWMLLSVGIIIITPSLDILFLTFLVSLFVQLIVLFDLDVLYTVVPAGSRSVNKIVYHLLQAGVPLMLSASMLTILFSVDRWFVNSFFDKIVLGQYALAVFGAMGVQLLITSIGQVYYPIIAHGYGRERTIGSQIKNIKVFLAISLVLIGTLIIAVWLLLPFIVNRFIPEYESGLIAARWVVLGGIFIPFSTVCSILFRIKNVLWLLVFGQSVGLLLGSLLVYHGCSSRNVEAIGQSVALSYLVYTISVCIVSILFFKGILPKKVPKPLCSVSM